MIKEAKIQQEIYSWFNNQFCLKFHNPRCTIFSVPNEGSNIKEMMYKKSIGLRTGVSDLIVVQPNRVLFVEVKTLKGKQGDAQIDFEKVVKSLGFEYFVVRSLEDFKKII